MWLKYLSLATFAYNTFNTQNLVNSGKVMNRYVGPIVVYTIIDPHNYLLMTLDEKKFARSIQTQKVETSLFKNK